MDSKKLYSIILVKVFLKALCLLFLYYIEQGGNIISTHYILSMSATCIYSKQLPNL